METEKKTSFSECKERGERAKQIYQELHQLVHNPYMAVTLDHVSIEVAFATGEIRSMGMTFEQPEPDSIDDQHYRDLGFSEEQIKRGILSLQVQRKVGPDEPVRKGLRSIVFTLSPNGITAVERTGISKGKATGTRTQLTPEELHLVNVFSFLSLAPDVIRTEFGSYDAWHKAAGYPNMAGIDGTDLNQDPPRDPLFTEGLLWHIRNYEKNLRGEQNRITAFREYIKRSGIQHVSPPQQ